MTKAPGLPLFITFPRTIQAAYELLKAESLAEGNPAAGQQPLNDARDLLIQARSLCLTEGHLDQAAGLDLVIARTHMLERYRTEVRDLEYFGANVAEKHAPERLKRACAFLSTTPAVANADLDPDPLLAQSFEQLRTMAAELAARSGQPELVELLKSAVKSGDELAADLLLTELNRRPLLDQAATETIAGCAERYHSACVQRAKLIARIMAAKEQGYAQVLATLEQEPRTMQPRWLSRLQNALLTEYATRYVETAVAAALRRRDLKRVVRLLREALEHIRKAPGPEPIGLLAWFRSRFEAMRDITTPLEQAETALEKLELSEAFRALTKARDFQEEFAGRGDLYPRLEALVNALHERYDQLNSQDDSLKRADEQRICGDLAAAATSYEELLSHGRNSLVRERARQGLAQVAEIRRRIEAEIPPALAHIVEDPERAVASLRDLYKQAGPTPEVRDYYCSTLLVAYWRARHINNSARAEELVRAYLDLREGDPYMSAQLKEISRLKHHHDELSALEDRLSEAEQADAYPVEQLDRATDERALVYETIAKGFDALQQTIGAVGHWPTALVIKQRRAEQHTAHWRELSLALAGAYKGQWQLAADLTGKLDLNGELPVLAAVGSRATLLKELWTLLAPRIETGRELERQLHRACKGAARGAALTELSGAITKSLQTIEAAEADLLRYGLRVSALPQDLAALQNQAEAAHAIMLMFEAIELLPENAPRPVEWRELIKMCEGEASEGEASEFARDLLGRAQRRIAQQINSLAAQAADLEEQAQAASLAQGANRTQDEATRIDELRHIAHSYSQAARQYALAAELAGLVNERQQSVSELTTKATYLRNLSHRKWLSIQVAVILEPLKKDDVETPLLSAQLEQSVRLCRSLRDNELLPAAAEQSLSAFFHALTDMLDTRHVLARDPQGAPADAPPVDARLKLLWPDHWTSEDLRRLCERLHNCVQRTVRARERATEKLFATNLSDWVGQTNDEYRSSGSIEKVRKEIKDKLLEKRQDWQETLHSAEGQLRDEKLEEARATLQQILSDLNALEQLDVRLRQRDTVEDERKKVEPILAVVEQRDSLVIACAEAVGLRTTDPLESLKRLSELGQHSVVVQSMPQLKARIDREVTQTRATLQKSFQQHSQKLNTAWRDKQPDLQQLRELLAGSEVFAAYPADALPPGSYEQFGQRRTELTELLDLLSELDLPEFADETVHPKSRWEMLSAARRRCERLAPPLDSARAVIEVRSRLERQLEVLESEHQFSEHETRRARAQLAGVQLTSARAHMDAEDYHEAGAALAPLSRQIPPFGDLPEDQRAEAARIQRVLRAHDKLAKARALLETQSRLGEAAALLDEVAILLGDPEADRPEQGPVSAAYSQTLKQLAVLQQRRQALLERLRQPGQSMALALSVARDLYSLDSEDVEARRILYDRLIDMAREVCERPTDDQAAPERDAQVRLLLAEAQGLAPENTRAEHELHAFEQLNQALALAAGLVRQQAFRAARDELHQALAGGANRVRCERALSEVEATALLLKAEQIEPLRSLMAGSKFLDAYTQSLRLLGQAKSTEVQELIQAEQLWLKARWPELVIAKARNLAPNTDAAYEEAIVALRETLIMADFPTRPTVEERIGQLERERMRAGLRARLQVLEDAVRNQQSGKARRQGAATSSLRLSEAVALAQSLIKELEATQETDLLARARTAGDTLSARHELAESLIAEAQSAADGRQWGQAVTDYLQAVALEPAYAESHEALAQQWRAAYGAQLAAQVREHLRAIPPNPRAAAALLDSAAESEAVPVDFERQLAILRTETESQTQIILMLASLADGRGNGEQAVTAIAQARQLLYNQDQVLVDRLTAWEQLIASARAVWSEQLDEAERQLTDLAKGELAGLPLIAQLKGQLEERRETRKRSLGTQALSAAREAHQADQLEQAYERLAAAEATIGSLADFKGELEGLRRQLDFRSKILSQIRGELEQPEPASPREAVERMVRLLEKAARYEPVVIAVAALRKRLVEQIEAARDDQLAQAKELLALARRLEGGEELVGLERRLRTRVTVTVATLTSRAQGTLEAWDILQTRALLDEAASLMPEDATIAALFTQLGELDRLSAEPKAALEEGWSQLAKVQARSSQLKLALPHFEAAAASFHYAMSGPTRLHEARVWYTYTRHLTCAIEEYIQYNYGLVANRLYRAARVVRLAPGAALPTVIAPRDQLIARRVQMAYYATRLAEQAEVVATLAALNQEAKAAGRAEVVTRSNQDGKEARAEFERRLTSFEPPPADFSGELGPNERPEGLELPLL